MVSAVAVKLVTRQLHVHAKPTCTIRGTGDTFRTHHSLLHVNTPLADLTTYAGYMLKLCS